MIVKGPKWKISTVYLKWQNVDMVDYDTGFPGISVVKNLPANARDIGSVPGLGISTGEGNGNPLQYSCLGNPTDRGAWWAIRVAKESDTLSD